VAPNNKNRKVETVLNRLRIVQVTLTHGFLLALKKILQNASPAELISLHKHILTKCRSHNSEREDNNLPLPDYVYGIFELQTVATNNIFNF